MRQRLGLAQAIMEKPRLLLLDEPTNGLDPQGVAELRSYIRHLADQGVAIFLASHLLNEVEQVCDRVAIVKQGHVLRQMSKNDPVPYRGFSLQVSDAKDWSLVQQWAAQHQATLSQKDGVQGGMVGTAVPVPAALRDLVQAGASIESITPDRDTLETTFLQAIQEEKK
jgi:ABC-2 type transport system ATP-binding protein